MTRFTDLVYNRIVRPNKTMFTMVFVVIIAAVFAVIGWRLYKSHKPKKDYSNAAAPVSEVTIHFFYATWCPHCVKAKPVWDEFVKKYNGRTINEMKISCVDHDCSDDGEGKPDIKQVMKEYSIESYPTIKAKVGNSKKIISYDAKVTAENLDKFVDTILYENPSSSVLQTVGMLN
jgi:thiol-disulfide isomerase/thioredoxin